MQVYTPTPELVKRVRSDFTYHPSNEEQGERMKAIRDNCYQLAHLILNLTPASREQSLALTNLEQVSMWANAAIARNEKGT